MKLRQLQCLCAVVDAGFNITRAAAALHATQPAVSKQVRELESQVGAELLLRAEGRPVGLTEAGERTLAWARHALQCVDNIRTLARESDGERGGTIAIATSHAHANYVLLPAITAFARRFPQVRFSVQQGAPEQVAALVREARVAIGITHLPEEIPKEVVAAPFLTSARTLVAPAGHPILKERRLTLERVAAHPLIIQHSQRPLGARIVRTFEEAGLAVQVVMQAIDPDVVKTYVAAGLGVGIVPAFSFSARRDRGLRARDVGHLFEPAVSAVLLRRRALVPRYVYAFLERVDPSLDRTRLEKLALS